MNPSLINLTGVLFRVSKMVVVLILTYRMLQQQQQQKQKTLPRRSWVSILLKDTQLK